MIVDIIYRTQHTALINIPDSIVGRLKLIQFFKKKLEIKKKKHKEKLKYRVNYKIDSQRFSDAII